MKVVMFGILAIVLVISASCLFFSIKFFIRAAKERYTSDAILAIFLLVLFFMSLVFGLMLMLAPAR